MYVVYRFVCTFYLPVYVKTKDILSHIIIIPLFCEAKFRIYNILFSLFFDITVFFRFFVIISAALLPPPAPPARVPFKAENFIARPAGAGKKAPRGKHIRAGAYGSYRFYSHFKMKVPVCLQTVLRKGLRPPAVVAADACLHQRTADICVMYRRKLIGM